MAQRPLAVLLLVALGRLSLGARLGNSSQPPPPGVPADGAAGRSAPERCRLLAVVAHTLPNDVALRVLGLVQGPPQLAWSTGGSATTLLSCSGAPAHVLEGNVSDIMALHFFPGGDRLIVVGASGRSVVWDARTGRAKMVLRHNSQLLSNLFDAQVFPAGDRVVTLGSDGAMEIHSARTGEVLRSQALAGVGMHRSARVLRGGTLVATGVSGIPGDPVAIWDIVGDAPARMLRLPGDAVVRLFEVDPAGTMLVTVSSIGMHMWNPETWELAWTWWDSTHWLRAVSISSGGAWVAGNAFGMAPWSVLTWSGATGRLCSRFPAVRGGIPSFTFLDEGRRLVTISPSGEGDVWDPGSGKHLLSLESVSGGALGQVAASPSGTVVAACSVHRGNESLAVVAAWDARTGRVLHREEAARRSGRVVPGLCSVAVGLARPMADAVCG